MAHYSSIAGREAVVDIWPQSSWSLGRTVSGHLAVGYVVNDRAWLTWKYIPSDDGFSAGVSHPTAMRIRSKITDAWHGTGSLRFHQPDRRHAPVSYPIVAALAALPAESEPVATMTRGSQELGLGHRLS